MVEAIKRVVHGRCTMADFGGADHVCVGRVRRVKVPIGFFARARKPYCELHAAWVQGK